MIVVDASVWVAWLTASDAHHAQSRAWLATWLDRSRTLTTPELAIVEVAGAIARRSGRPELGRRAAAAVMACPSLDVYRMEAHDVRLATTLAAEYLIPGNDPRLEQYSIHSRADYEDSTTVENRLFLIGVGQKLQAGDWQRLTALDWQIERFRYFDTPADIMLLIPSVTFSRSTVDDSLRVYRGERLSLQLRGALEPILSDNTFFQVTAGVKEVWPLGKDMRLLARFDAGTTWTSDPEQLPSSVRYYAGGDTSIRGYEYQSIGPRNDRDKVIGGRHMLVGSIELEHRVVGDWSVAAFVDAGDAFERSPSMKLGAGIGVRWTSPIGPIRLDLAHGFDEPGDAFRIHFTLGPDL